MTTGYLIHDKEIRRDAFRSPSVKTIVIVSTATIIISLVNQSPTKGNQWVFIGAGNTELR